MKRMINYFVMLLIVAVVFASCNETEISDPFPSAEIEGCYIVNYGNFGSGGASISKYDYITDKMTNFYFEAQNGGNELLSNIQYAYSVEDSIYLIGNAVDQLITVNPFFEQNQNGITGEMENPRFCIADGDYLYISCWGASPDYDDMPNSYVAKFNRITNTTEEYFDLPGGPEGMAIANGKLYVALNYISKVAVINLQTEAVSYIETPAVTSYFVQDSNDNLYVTLVSTWSDFSNETGIGYINTSSDELESTYDLAGVSSGYGSIIQANSDFSKIYVVTSAYDANWNLTGAVSEFDVAGKKFNDNQFVSDISGISGLAVNPKNSDVYVFAAQSVTSAGLMKIYSSAGNFVQDIDVGASPIGTLFLE